MNEPNLISANPGDLAPIPAPRVKPTQEFLISLMPFAHHLYDHEVDSDTAEELAGTGPSSFNKDQLGVSIKAIAKIVHRLADAILNPEN